MTGYLKCALLMLFSFSSIAAMRALVDPDICACRYEALWIGEWVLLDCYREVGFCAESCEESYDAGSGTYRCRCNSGLWDDCNCYGQTVYANGQDPETVCVDAGCAGTNHTCKERSPEPSDWGWYRV